jgi:hypothetical protein
MRAVAGTTLALIHPDLYCQRSVMLVLAALESSIDIETL